jgi:hypothetical protein
VIATAKLALSALLEGSPEFGGPAIEAGIDAGVALAENAVMDGIVKGLTGAVMQQVKGQMKPGAGAFDQSQDQVLGSVSDKFADSLKPDGFKSALGGGGTP